MPSPCLDSGTLKLVSPVPAPGVCVSRWRDKTCKGNREEGTLCVRLSHGWQMDVILPLTLIEQGWQPGARGERDSEAHLDSLGVMAAVVPG